MNDPFEQIRRLNEVLNQNVHQALEPYLRLQKEIQEQLATFSSSYQEALHQALERSLRVRSAIDETLRHTLVSADLLAQIQQVNRAVYEPSLQIQKMFQEVIPQSLRINEVLSESFHRWQEVQRQQLGISSRSLDQFQAIFRELNNLTQNIPAEDFSVNPDGTIAVQGEAASAEEIHEAITQFIEFLTSLSPSVTAQNLFNFIREWLTRFRHPVALLLTTVILPYIIGTITNLTTPYFERQLESLNRSEKREIIKASREKVLQTSEAASLKNYRFVSATILHVRRTGSLSAPIIGRVYLGQIVRVCEKRKNWSLIEYGDRESEETLRGWVFTRYIKRFQE